MTRSTLATVGILVAPVLLAAALLLALVSAAVVAHQVVCLHGPAPAGAHAVGEGSVDGERVWLPVGERCTWATATGGTVTSTHYDLGASAGVWGGVAGALASVALFVSSARAGRDSRPAPPRAATG